MGKFFLLSLALYYSGCALASSDDSITAPICPDVSNGYEFISSVSYSLAGETSCAYTGGAMVSSDIEIDEYRYYNIFINDKRLDGSASNNKMACPPHLEQQQKPIHIIARCFKINGNFYDTSVEGMLVEDVGLLTKKIAPMSLFMYSKKDDNGNIAPAYAFNTTTNAITTVDLGGITRIPVPINFGISIEALPNAAMTVLSK